MANVVHVRWIGATQDAARLEASSKATIMAISKALINYPPFRNVSYDFVDSFGNPVPEENFGLVTVGSVSKEGVIYIRRKGIPSGAKILATARATPKKMTENLLKFEKGDTLVVLQQNEDNPWWWCEFRGKQGYVQKDYLVVHVAKDMKSPDSDDDDIPPPPPRPKGEHKDDDGSGSEEEYRPVQKDKAPLKKPLTVPDPALDHLESLLRGIKFVADADPAESVVIDAPPNNKKKQVSLGCEDSEEDHELQEEDRSSSDGLEHEEEDDEEDIPPPPPDDDPPPPPPQ
jgi:hypothetical protein